MQTIKFEEIESNIISQADDTKKDNTRNVIVEAAIPLLNKASQMKYFQSKLPTTEVLQGLKKDIEKFEEKAEESGVRYETVKAARYCLCTLLDEFAAKNGWADQEWAAHSLLVTFHNETWGGEQFFQLIDRVKQEPHKNINLIELMYYCLVLGYMGKYQVLNNGKVSIENIKKELEKIIRQYGSSQSAELLLNNENKNKLLTQKGRHIPLWILAVLTAALLLIIYAIFNWKLAQNTNEINTRINKLNVQQVQSSTERVQLLTPLLKNEIDNRLLQVEEVPGKSTITILGDELFTSGSDKIQDRYYPVMAAVGQALNEVKGRVVVSGYSDDQPISSVAFPSNWHLSQARADAVKSILLNYVQDGNRVRSEGKGSENPRYPNNSVENRAKNRRVEITVFIEQGNTQPLATNSTQVANN
ncbi:type IVB secretion system protein IcmH/DotU [Acinetobacter gerneri]|uniref:type IVB secretion system protein IcmH/DotU n=1 Tax=Acinetobacter gerneri TaxID=202952 RepID=UPI002936526C|nr:type IVB secretion system protein IcmH/DotU [Acinetobacter gerneri]MDV2441326.1 type IVB secretion system protein IcmH/DotU [Acinetobacter gerneri]